MISKMRKYMRSAKKCQNPFLAFQKIALLCPCTPVPIHCVLVPQEEPPYLPLFFPPQPLSSQVQYPFILPRPQGRGLPQCCRTSSVSATTAGIDSKVRGILSPHIQLCREYHYPMCPTLQGTSSPLAELCEEYHHSDVTSSAGDTIIPGAQVRRGLLSPPKNPALQGKSSPHVPTSAGDMITPYAQGCRGHCYSIFPGLQGVLSPLCA